MRGEFWTKHAELNSKQLGGRWECFVNNKISLWVEKKEAYILVFKLTLSATDQIHVKTAVEKKSMYSYVM